MPNWIYVSSELAKDRGKNKNVLQTTCRVDKMNKGFSPKFLRRYADLFSSITDAVGQYITDVKNGDFPNENERY